MVIYIKEEPTMQISVSSTLTVYHDGQFWVGLAEHVEGGRYGVQGTTGARGTAGSDEAGVGSSKKSASRG